MPAFGDSLRGHVAVADQADDARQTEIAEGHITDRHRGFRRQPLTRLIAMEVVSEFRVRRAPDVGLLQTAIPDQGSARRVDDREQPVPIFLSLIHI